MALALMAFVSVYRMGDVLALNLSKPMIRELGYSLTEIGLADSYVALVASIIGVGLGGLMAARWRQGWTLAIGAFFAALGNFGFVWLAHQPVDGRPSTSPPPPTSSATAWPGRCSSSISRCW